MADVDECQSSPPCAEVCRNTNGRFYCDCSESGYEVVVNNEVCVGEYKSDLETFGVMFVLDRIVTAIFRHSILCSLTE